jgi:hypothetical protein
MGDTLILELLAREEYTNHIGPRVAFIALFLGLKTVLLETSEFKTTFLGSLRFRSG